VLVNFFEERLRFADIQFTGNALDVYGKLVVGRIACFGRLKVTLETD